LNVESRLGLFIGFCFFVKLFDEKERLKTEFKSVLTRNMSILKFLFCRKALTFLALEAFNEKIEAGEIRCCH